MPTNQSLRSALAADLTDLHNSWGWFVALGIALIVLGVACIIGNMTATLATVLAFGWLLLIGAVFTLIQAFRVRSWSGFFLLLLTALLRGFTGYLLVRYPGSGEVALTLLLASLFIVGGTFRLVGASSLQFPRWGWMAASGVLSMVLGAILLWQLPTSSVWFIGFALGVDFVFDGASFISLGTALRHIPPGQVLAGT